jgi:hypothetical protein
MNIQGVAKLCRSRLSGFRLLKHNDVTHCITTETQVSASLVFNNSAFHPHRTGIWGSHNSLRCHTLSLR